MTPHNTLQTLVDLGPHITAIVVTGGPCSGKSTGLTHLAELLSDRGYKVLVSPESATKLITAGAHPTHKELGVFGFQQEILLDTLAQEERILSLAKRYRDAGKKVVVLFDRGTLDGEAYIGAAAFGRMLKKMGYTYRELSDERYHAVMHLRTAALGAEKYYTLANNHARHETLAEARLLDERTLAAWERHQHPRVIDNRTDFPGKIRRLYQEVCAVLGDPIPLEKEEKFLVHIKDLRSLPIRAVKSRIEQDYLISGEDGTERRVRARTSGGGTSYYYTEKRHISRGVRVERERLIGEREYAALLKLRDPKCSTIRKERVCFFWKEQFFELDCFIAPRRGLLLLEVELTDEHRKIVFPPFIKVVRNVTGDREYSNKQIALSHRQTRKERKE